MPSEQRATERCGILYLPLFAPWRIGNLPFAWVNFSANESTEPLLFGSFQLQSMDVSVGCGKDPYLLSFC